MNMKVLASAVSLLFNPGLFFLIIPFFVVYKETASGLYALKWVIFSSLFIFLGIIYFLIGIIRGTFSDFDLTKKEERKSFYFFAWFLAVIYLLIAIFFKGIFFPLSIFAIGVIIGLLVFEFVNAYIKASIHVGAASTFVVIISLLYGSFGFWGTFWIVPIVAWSRITLKKHTPKEVLIGAMLGSGLSFVIFLLGEQILSVFL